MNKLLSLMVVVLLPALAVANDTPDQAELALMQTDTKAEVSVIALSPEQALELAKIRSDYKASKILLETEYKARVDAVLTRNTADNS